MSNSGASSESVNQLIQWLAEQQKDCTSIEIAETLWLAMKIESAAPFVAEEPIVVGDLEQRRSDPLDRDLGFEPPTVQPPAPRVNIAAPTVAVGVLPPKTLPVWLADPAMLTDSLAIIRALRPLLQKVATGTGKRLDEAATVETIARTRLWLPVLKPEQEPWFDIVLVVDRGSSMHIWQRLVKDVVRILRSYGAFRDVQVFDLVVDAEVQLFSKPDRPGHRPSEVIDQQGRRIVIVLSDCAGKYWWDGTLLPTLQAWGKIMPTVVWQMLPAWMWRRTALGRGTAIAIANDIPGVENQRLKTRIQERKEPDGAEHRMPVPVVTSEVRDLERWSWMVVGDRRGVTPGFLLPQGGGVVPRSRGIEERAEERVPQDVTGSDREFAVNQEIDAIARERVQRFTELSSPQAQRLVMLLAAAPVITLPVVRLIRDAMLSESRSPLPVAEVFLSGLLQRLPGQEDERLREESDRTELIQQDSAQDDQGSLAAQDFVQYEFVPRVRQALLEVLPTVDTIDVINRVSAAVERRWNQVSNQDFRAFLTNPNVEVSEELAGLRSFASVTADILESLGGDYASFVEQLRVGAGVTVPPGDSGSEEEDFQVVDLEYEAAKFIDFPALQDCEYESATITAILDRFDFETATIALKKRRLRKDVWEIDRRSAIAWGYTEVLGEEVDLDMIAIPGGSFTMGSPEREPKSTDDERPQHEVTLQPFYLGRYAITQAQWRVVARYNRIDRDLDPNPSKFKGDSRPVERVSWEEAQEFCQRLSAATGKNYQLPSEAQWEYACRAGTKTPFYYGETIAPELANYNGDYVYCDGVRGEYRAQTTEVGIFPANKWGLHDMHGSVWEWCRDEWHSNYIGAPNNETTWIEIDQKEASRSLRGGSWHSGAENCRSSVRRFNACDNRNSHLGFRVSCVLPRILPSWTLRPLALSSLSTS
jgi:formylglycine-generating enzyme required for sulfatase activity